LVGIGVFEEDYYSEWASLLPIIWQLLRKTE
jgi:hypothetical protein